MPTKVSSIITSAKLWVPSGAPLHENDGEGAESPSGAAHVWASGIVAPSVNSALVSANSPDPLVSSAGSVSASVSPSVSASVSSVVVPVSVPVVDPVSVPVVSDVEVLVVPSPVVVPVPVDPVLLDELEPEVVSSA